MADRSYLTRLRTSGGPSHDLLILLDRHRVMTTGQLARATGTPERTIRYRLDRLHAAGLVECVRPGRETGSAPRHWWLRPAGARLVAGIALADGRPSGMFVAHAAAITEVWLALTEHGPAEGIQVTDWLTDRAGWQEWKRTGAWSTHPHRLTPDAAATMTVDGAASVAAFVEVDLASMTQTLLKQKVARYLAYADDRAWEDRHPHCPPMLLLTTTATRAATFVRVAGPMLARHGQTVDSNDPAAALVVAACGLVRAPARAVTETCWSLPDTAAELSLAELLGERLDAQARSRAWEIEQDTVVRRREAIDALSGVQRFTGLADWLGSQPAAEALQFLISSGAAAFLDDEPDLANQVVDWLDERRRINRFRARDLAQPIVCALEQRHTRLWVDQARHLLSAEEHIMAGHPHLYRLAVTLASGRLAGPEEIAILGSPPAETREQIQRRSLGDYPIRRATAVDRAWRALGRRERRRTSRDQLAAAHDDTHLAVCGSCGIAEPQPEPDQTAPDRCVHCDGVLLDWPQRPAFRTVTKHLDTIRQRLSSL